ncbi:MAG: phage shock protein PspA [Psychromonas sp.]|nr:phage shock protein PspA [Alteromonadales bacterium]MCP5079118.1 phage shock protein PspA [Psychromonas sp.]
MSIFSRFTDIVNSNITSLLDKAEDPAKMVRLIIQEMEDTLVEVRSNSVRLLADKKELQRRIGRITNQVNDWQTKAELALSKEREDLARAALVEKQKAAEQAELAAQDMEVIEEQLELLKSEITQLQAKLDETRARKKSMVIRKDTAATRLQVKRQLDSSSIQSSLDKFEQYERRIEDLESQVEAQDLGNKTLQQEFSELQADDAISDELEALKKKMNTN